MTKKDLAMEKRTLVLAIYLTPAEHRQIEIAAAAYTTSMSSWARLVLMAVVRQKKDLLAKIRDDEELFDSSLLKV